MQQITRLSLGAALCIALLRMGVGYHFFKEGETKVRDGNFSSEGFFRQSKGELSPFFKGLLADEDAKFRLCYAPETELGTDSSLTFEYWEDFGSQVATECRLLEQDIKNRRNATKSEIERLRQSNSDSSRLNELIAEYEADEVRIIRLREHVAEIGPTLRRHMDEFDLFLEGYEEEIRNYFRSLDRLDGFRRDGDTRGEVVEGVASLYDQRATIYGDIMKERAPLVGQVEAAWDAVEHDLNDVGIEEYKYRSFVSLERPYEKRPLMAWVDKIIPYHHMIIGGLIFFGLFCRPASLLAAFFLILICACQLPWATGALPTYYQIIELLALLSLAAVGAGRYAGLDYFVELIFRTNESTQEEGDTNESYA